MPEGYHTGMAVSAILCCGSPIVVCEDVVVCRREISRGAKINVLGTAKKPHTQKLVTLDSGLGKAEYKAE
jgi:hypothetical protein